MVLNYKGDQRQQEKPCANNWDNIGGQTNDLWCVVPYDWGKQSFAHNCHESFLNLSELEFLQRIIVSKTFDQY